MLTTRLCQLLIMIPVLKKGTDKKKAVSYRPISLTSCVTNTPERVVSQHLICYLKPETSWLVNRQALDSFAAEKTRPPTSPEKN